MSNTERQPLLSNEQSSNEEHGGGLEVSTESSRGYNTSTDDSRTTSTRAAPSGSGNHAILVILTCVCNALPAGFTYATSYLINPVSGACPVWTSSATVYGASAIYAGWLVGGLLGLVMNRKHLRFYYLMTTLGSALAIGTAGVMVMFCNDMGLVGEILYLGTFSLYGLVGTITYLINCELALLSMSKWPGFAGGLHGMSVGVGGLVIPQIVIGLRQVFSSSGINPGAIFFCLATMRPLLSAPWLALLSIPSADRVPDSKLPESKPTHTSSTGVTREFFKDYKLWLICVAGFTGAWPVLALVAVQEGFIRDLWNEPHAPISTLSALLMAFFVAGRLLYPLCSDRIGLKRLWVLSLITQSILLLGLGLLLVENNHKNLKYLGIVFLCLYYAIFPAFKSAMAGISHHVFGGRFRLAGVGAMQAVSGIAGITGPIVIETIHTHFNSYKPFVFGSCVTSMIGAIAVIAVRAPRVKVPVDDSPTANVQE